MTVLWAFDWRRGLADLRATLAGARWRGGGERLLARAGLLLIASGALHGALGAGLGWSFEGAVSPRKPALFGLATGVTLVSLGWVHGLLTRRRGPGWLPVALALAALLEVAVITLQFWRGAESHFNRRGGLDTALSWVVEACALLLTVTIGVYVAWSCGPRSLSDSAWARVSRAKRLAVRFGLVSLLLGCGFGVYMVGYGHRALASGGSPGTYGHAGVLQFVHGAPLHAIQVMPLAVWALELGSFTERMTFQSTALGIASYVAFYGYTAAQTFSGHDRFDVTTAGAILLGVSGLLGVLSVAPLILRAATESVRRRA